MTRGCPGPEARGKTTDASKCQKGGDEGGGPVSVSCDMGPMHGESDTSQAKGFDRWKGWAGANRGKRPGLGLGVGEHERAEDDPSRKGSRMQERKNKTVTSRGTKSLCQDKKGRARSCSAMFTTSERLLRTGSGRSQSYGASAPWVRRFHLLFDGGDVKQHGVAHDASKCG